MQRKKIGIIGAGIGGLTAGALLSKKGFDVTIFEKESFMLTNVCLLAQKSAEERIFINLDDVILKYMKGF